MDLSVVIPVHKGNSGKLLRCLRSLKETSKAVDFELLLVCSGFSVDDTIHISDRSFKNMRIFASKKTMNAAASRNCGIRNSRRTWIAFLDSDCLVSKGYFQTAGELITTDGCQAFVGDVGYCGNSFLSWCEAMEHFESLSNYLYENKKTLYSKVLVGANSIIKRSLIKAIGLFDETMNSSEDKELGARLYAKGHRMKYDTRLKVFHMYPESIVTAIGRHVRHSEGNAQNYLRYPSIFNGFWIKRYRSLRDGFSRFLKKEMPSSYLLYKIVIVSTYTASFLFFYLAEYFGTHKKVGENDKKGTSVRAASR